MELVIQVLMLFIVINSVVKLSFWRWWQAAIFGAVCGVFVIVACQWAVLQSKTQLADYLANRNIMQDLAVIITLESVLCFAFCFASLLGNGKRKWWTMPLKWYPGVLIFPVLFYLLTQTIYAMPGVAFDTVSYVLAACAAVGLPLLSYGIRWLYPERGLRLEVHFLVSLFVCLIGLITTVNGNITYTSPGQPFNIRAVLLAVSIFAVLFLGGVIWNKRKWKFKKKIK